MSVFFEPTGMFYFRVGALENFSIHVQFGIQFSGIRACFRAAPSSNFVGITRTPVPVQHPKLRAPRHKCQSSREDSTRLANFIKDVIDVFLASVLAFLLLALVFLDRGLELALRGIRAVGVLGLAVFLSLYQFFVEAKQNTGELKKLDEAK